MNDEMKPEFFCLNSVWDTYSVKPKPKPFSKVLPKKSLFFNSVWSNSVWSNRIFVTSHSGTIPYPYEAVTDTGISLDVKHRYIMAKQDTKEKLL